MPTYEYRCRDCGEDLEVYQSFTEDALTVCPKCGGSLRKLFGNVGISFKGTGFYKIPSLRGVWYRPRLLHDASVTSLEEMFDPARTSPEYEPKGWNPPGMTKRAVPGHTFGLSLNAEDRKALLAFLRSL